MRRPALTTAALPGLWQAGVLGGGAVLTGREGSLGRDPSAVRAVRAQLSGRFMLMSGRRTSR